MLKLKGPVVICDGVFWPTNTEFQVAKVDNCLNEEIKRLFILILTIID